MLKTKLLLGALAMTLAPTAMLAATLNAIPMQGGMVMPVLSYRASDGRLRVVLAATIPQLTPLLASHPSDNFDPGDPWFDWLSPSRQGLAFSRHYGFVMDATTDPLPAEKQIWIRKLSGSPGLSAYRYSNSAPKVFEPIFGTDGATNALHWNGMMFHPVFAAAPGTNTFTATFEAFLVDVATGSEVPNSSTGPFVLNWASVPDGRPELAIAQRIVVCWPKTAANYRLEGAEALPNGTWTVVTNAPVLLEDEIGVVLDQQESRKFFRLRLAQ